MLPCNTWFISSDILHNSVAMPCPFRHEAIDFARGCTPDFSRAKAKIRVLVPCVGNILGTKLCEQVEPHPIPPPTLYIQDHFSLNRPLRYYYRPIAGVSSRFWRRSRRGYHLCVRLRSQNREFATPRGEKNIADSTKLREVML